MMRAYRVPMTLVLVLALVVSLTTGSAHAVAAEAPAPAAIARGVIYLADQQGGDGHFYFSAGQDNRCEWTTAQALWALSNLLAAAANLPEASVNKAVYEQVSSAQAGARDYLASRYRQAAPGSPTADWDWAVVALGAAAAGRDVADYGPMLLATVAQSDFSATAPVPTATTDLARALMAGASLSIPNGEIKDKNGKTVIEALCERQITEGENRGHFGNLRYEVSWGDETYEVDESAYVNSHVWAILSLAAAGQDVPGAAAAREWLLTRQNDDGGWGWSTTPDMKASDPDVTAQVLRALAVLGEPAASEAVTRAFAYIKGMQNEDGGLHGSWDPVSNAASDAEALQASAALGLNPLMTGLAAEQQWLQDVLTHLLSLQSLDYQDPGQGDTPGQGGGGSDPGDGGAVNVTVEVRGPGGQRLYDSRTVTLAGNERTPLGALRALGATVELGFNGQYVVAIDGVAEAGTGGWKFAVNGNIPQRSAADYTVPLQDGDVVVWFYAESYEDSGGYSEEVPLEPSPGAGNLLSPEEEKARSEIAAAARDELVALQQAQTPGPEVAEAGRAAGFTRVLGRETPMPTAENEYWRELLAENRVAVSRELPPDRDGEIADPQGEIALEVPAGSFDETTEVVINEEDYSQGKWRLPLNTRPVSPVYRFGPDGLVLHKPATLVLRFDLPSGGDPNNLELARAGAGNGRWTLLPAVVDLANGQILGALDRFCAIVVLERRWQPVSFRDVGDGRGAAWAGQEIELLAGAGVVAGVGEGVFAPARGVTRAELATMLDRALQLIQPGLQSQPEALPFADVGADAGYAAPVTRVYREGIMSGYPDGAFRPDRVVSRQELACALARLAAAGAAAKMTGAELTESLAGFVDQDDIAPWARSGVGLASRLGLILGLPGGALQPLDAVTRAQAAVMLYRLLEIRQREG